MPLPRRPSSRLRRLLLFLTRPGEWSAERYREKNSMEYSALHPGRWRARDTEAEEAVHGELQEGPGHGSGHDH